MHLIAEIHVSSHEAGPNESSRPFGFDDPKSDFIDIGVGGGLFSGKEAAAVIPRCPSGFLRSEEKVA